MLEVSFLKYFCGTCYIDLKLALIIKLALNVRATVLPEIIFWIFIF